MKSQRRVYLAEERALATRGAVDHYTIQRGANYYNGLLTGNDNDFHELLTKYAIYPGDGIPGYKPETIGSVGVRSRATKQVLVEAHANNITTAKIDSGHKVGYINLSLSGRQQGVTHPGDRIEFQATSAPTQGYVPAYFLPWADDFAIRLTIPPIGQRTGKSRSDPGIFFTAAISGCSVIFQGTPDNPTIYHCGGNSDIQAISIMGPRSGKLWWTNSSQTMRQTRARTADGCRHR